MRPCPHMTTSAPWTAAPLWCLSAASYLAPWASRGTMSKEVPRWYPSTCGERRLPGGQVCLPRAVCFPQWRRVLPLQGPLGLACGHQDLGASQALLLGMQWGWLGTAFPWKACVEQLLSSVHCSWAGLASGTLTSNCCCPFWPQLLKRCCTSHDGKRMWPDISLYNLKQTKPKLI